MLKSKGFTLVETMAALAILVLGIMLIVGGYLYFQRNYIEFIAQDTLDMDLSMSVKRLQTELRLTSLSEISYWPSGAQEFTAISFPTEPKITELKETEEDKEWGKTIIYHSFGEGSEQRLLRTVFSPRDNTLNTEERQEQLNQVVTDGNAENAANGENATTICLFQHVFNWKITPQGCAYDGYSAQLGLDREVSIGSIIMDSGDHSLQFTVSGKDSRSSGYAIGLDTLQMTSSGLAQEAESASSSGTPSSPKVEYNSSGLWSGYHQLSLNATGTGSVLNVNFYNDCWIDTNFDLTGNTKSNVATRLSDTTKGIALTLKGNTTNWTATAQTKDPDGMPAGSAGTALKGAAVRTIIRGVSMSQGIFLEHNGAKCRVAFTADAENALGIDEAYIDELIESTNIAPNTVGNPTRITFNTQPDCTIAAGETQWSDPVAFPINAEKSYAITFKISDSTTRCQPRIWIDQNGVVGTYILPATNTLSSADLIAANWTDFPAISNSAAATIGLEMLHTYYPAKGVYTSPAMDTLMNSPAYEKTAWTGTENGTVTIEVRSGDKKDMSDASNWTAVPATESIAPSSINGGRYIQYRATLTSSGLITPNFQNFQIKWPGETRMVDIGGIFVNGPSNGQFIVTMDNQPLASPLRVMLELEQEIEGMNKQKKTMHSRAMFELSPRNTGRQ